jgi:hypothetical protein
MNRMRLVLFDMHNRTHGPCLAAIHRSGGDPGPLTTDVMSPSAQTCNTGPAARRGLASQNPPKKTPSTPQNPQKPPKPT